MSGIPIGVRLGKPRVEQKESAFPQIADMKATWREVCVDLSRARKSGASVRTIRAGAGAFPLRRPLTSNTAIRHFGMKASGTARCRRRARAYTACMNKLALREGSAKRE